MTKNRLLLWWLLLITVVAPQTLAQKTDPGSSDVAYQQGLEYQKANRNVEAIEAFKQAIALRANFADAYAKLAEVYATVGQYDDAVNTLQGLINRSRTTQIPITNSESL